MLCNDDLRLKEVKTLFRVGEGTHSGEGLPDVRIRSFQIDILQCWCFVQYNFI